jgi:hypothetical protein
MGDITKAIEKVEKSDEKIKKFGDLLNSIEKSDDKKKLLWQEIYENAISDREQAQALLSEARAEMTGGAYEHSTMGPTLSKYLERMNKSNEQILKLAELISKAEERTERIDPDDLFSQINEGTV